MNMGPYSFIQHTKVCKTFIVDIIQICAQLTIGYTQICVSRWYDHIWRPLSNRFPFIVIVTLVSHSSNVRMSISWGIFWYQFILCGWVSKNILCKKNWVGTIFWGTYLPFFGTHFPGRAPNFWIFQKCPNIGKLPLVRKLVACTFRKTPLKHS